MDLQEPAAQGRDLSRRVEQLIQRRVGTRTDASVRASVHEQHRGQGMPSQIGLAFDVWRESEFEHPIWGPVITGIKERAWAHGADLALLRPFPRLPGGEAAARQDSDWYVRRCRSSRLAGVITFSTVALWPEIQGLVAAEIPCVAIDDYLIGARASHVSSDNVGGARQAVAHLLALGRRRIATLTGDTASGPGSDRLRGWQIEQEYAGLGAARELVADCEWLEERAHAETLRLLALPEPPDAIFAQSDGMAAGAMHAIAETGRRVPEDVAVVGFDDSELARLASPQLTSVRQDAVGLGIAAAEVLFHIIDRPDEPPPVAVVPVELVVRQSTVAAAPGEGASGE
jgi:LacI family transcriptional regulator